MAQEVGCFSQGGGNNPWSPCRSQFVLCELCRSPFNLLKVTPSDELEWNEPSIDTENSSLSPRPGDYTGFIWVTLIFIFIWHCRQGISAKPLCCSQGLWIFEISISRNMKMFKKFNPRGTSEILKPWAEHRAWLSLTCQSRAAKPPRHFCSWLRTLLQLQFLSWK